MKLTENRRAFLQKFGLLSLMAGTGSLITGNVSGSDAPAAAADLVSLTPDKLFTVLDIDLPEMAEVKRALSRRGNNAALEALLKHYRAKYPRPAVKDEKSAALVERAVARADDMGKHIFQWGPYDAAGYGPDIDWAADPAGDIEWVAAVYRFYWVSDLVTAWEATGDEKYPALFVELASDWIRKHPLETTVEAIHPVYGWKGYPWLDLQTGIRATNICSSFRSFVHARSFTPGFLGLLLTSLYDHQVKTEKMPMNKVHNKAIFEQRGFFNVLHTFPEYRDKTRWLNLAIGITCENLIAQTTSDGVQREWCGGYHSGVYRDALEIRGRVSDLGHTLPEYYHERVRLMAEHILGLSTPDLGFPMFGDTARSKPSSADRKTWQLYNTLVEASAKFNDPRFQALADLDVSKLPGNGSVAFQEAGLYAMRSGWTPGDVYMALHCSPPAISTHDTPDNGTFELFAYGRWLMPDSGFYTYGHDRDARNWHRQTRVHPTMTLNGQDTAIVGRQLAWSSTGDMDVLCVENQSYRYFIHRRTVWFADKKSRLPFIVLLDEAIADSDGDLELHFPMAPGRVVVDNPNGRIMTAFDDANLLIQVSGKKPFTFRQEEGWHAWSYGSRERRTSVTAVYNGLAPYAFVSILVPYKGTSAPGCRLITPPEALIAGLDPVQLEVEVAGKRHILTRKIV